MGWLEKETLKLKGITKELMDNENAALELIDDLVSCRLPENDEKEFKSIFF